MDEKKAPTRQRKNGLDRLPPDGEKLLTSHDDDNHRDDRRRLLEVAYEFLTRTKAEPNTVLTILRQVKKRAFIEKRKRQGTLTGRALLRERDIYAAEAREALRGLEERIIGDEPNVLPERIAALLKILESPTFPSMNGHNPRFRKGAPAAPWIEQAKAELEAAGVAFGFKGFGQRLQAEGVRATPSNFHDALLMAVGAARYRST